MDTVICPNCREENPAKFRLCGYCGTSLAPPETVRCPSCGEENPGRFRLCGFCGTPLPGAAPPMSPSSPAGDPTAWRAAPVAPAPADRPAPPASSPGGAPVPPVAAPAELGGTEVRKPATFIFVDLKGSTALTERIDQEAMNEIKKRYFTVMSAQIEQHGGTIEKYIGDAIMAVFGIPRAHEDDALRAVRAAHGMQQELVRLNEEFLPFYGVELANRTGVNTGEVVANTDPNANQQLATGDTVNVAARLEQAAPANEILIGETTYDLVRGHVDVEPVEPLELKGKSERVPAYRLVGLRAAGSEGGAGALTEAPLVGRAAEWAQLGAVFDGAVADRACRLVTVMGDPGVGKSRLVKDFTTARSADARVLRGRCLPYGDGITFWPLLEVAREAAGITEEDSPATARERLIALVGDADPDAEAIVDRVAAAIGLATSPFPVSELFWGGRRFLEILAADRPVVVVVDDLHWAQPTFLDFLVHLVSASRTAAILVLATARHVLVEKHADWGERAGSPVIDLEPLTAEDTAGLADHLLGGSGLDADTRTKVVRAADGNPLFVEQMVSMLVDKGILQHVDGRWVPAKTLDDVAVPPTIQALLASRLDDLSREERAVVEPAAVIGLVFFEPALEEMVPIPVREAVPVHLTTLDGKQFVSRDASDPEEETYRFRHGLIRDATYGSLLKRTRAQLHERFVTWAERVNRERGREQEFEEILGFHLEQAYRYRTELGPLDDTGRALARRAAEKLGAAGRRAFARGDMPAAADLLRRTTALLPTDDPERIALLPDLAEALMEQGKTSEATEAADEATAAAERIGDARLAARARLARLAVDFFEGAATIEAVVDGAGATIPAFETVGDDGGLARTHRLLMVVHGTAGRFDDAADAAERVVSHAMRAGDTRMAARGAAGYATVALGGPTPVATAMERCTELLDQVRGDRKAEAVILGVLAQLHAMLGEFDTGRDMYRRGQAMLADLGPSVTASTTSTESWRVEALAGDLAAAERELRRDHDQLEAIDERYFRSTVAALLAGVLIEAGRPEEADRYAASAAELTDEDDVNSGVLWRLARARLLAAAGAAAGADALAREAIGLAADTQDLVLQADAQLALAEVLAAAGDRDAAGPPLREALASFERKGDRVSADRVRARLADVSG